MAASDKPKTHTLHLTNGGALLIKTMTTAPGWYEGQPFAIGMAGSQVGENLCDLVPPEADASPDAEKRNMAWAKEPHDIEVTEKQRDALKICVRHFYKKGALQLNQHTRKLVSELGMMDE